MIAAGVAYVYYSGTQTEKVVTVEPEIKDNKPVLPTPKKPGPNAPVSAAVQYIGTPVKAGENSTITVTTGPEATAL